MNEPKERTCWACTRPLQKNQKICLDCDNWQNWRRHLYISNSSLALVVALLSIATVLLQNIDSALSLLNPIYKIRGNGFIQFSAVGEVRPESVIDGFGIEAHFTNVGNRDLEIANYVSCSVQDGAFLNFVSAATDQSTFVKSGESLSLSYSTSFLERLRYENLLSVCKFRASSLDGTKAFEWAVEGYLPQAYSEAEVLRTTYWSF